MTIKTVHRMKVKHSKKPYNSISVCISLFLLGIIMAPSEPLSMVPHHALCWCFRNSLKTEGSSFLGLCPGEHIGCLAHTRPLDLHDINMSQETSTGRYTHERTIRVVFPAFHGGLEACADVTSSFGAISRSASDTLTVKGCR